MKERVRPMKVELDDLSNGHQTSGRSLTQIFQDIVGHVSEIIRSEVHLARTELKEDMRKAAKVAVFFATAAGFGFYALGFLLLGAVYALGSTLPAWLAAVLVGGATGAVAICLFLVGRLKMKKGSFRPELTIQTLEDNVTWLKKQTR